MQPRIQNTNSKKLIGKRLPMSFADYRVGELWRAFMPQRNNIINNLNNDLISVAVYQPSHFTHFKPTNTFERWAAVEVANFDHVPHEMETLVVPGGWYAIFHYQGLSTDNSIF